MFEERRSKLIKLYFSDIPKIQKVKLIGSINELDFTIQTINHLNGWEYWEKRNTFNHHQPLKKFQKEKTKHITRRKEYVKVVERYFIQTIQRHIFVKIVQNQND